MNVLFVCTGNVCRSPMAEGFLRQEALERGLGLDVRSTGTHAWSHRAATWDGREVMSELGVPIDDHRTRPLDEALIAWADLVIGLAAEHVRDVANAYPEAADRTFGLKELVHLLSIVPLGPDLPETLSRLAEARPQAATLEETDVLDPFGERRRAYERVAGEIRELVSRLADRFSESSGVRAG